ncbi:HPP family protein [Quisquiliibacterium transsilvanicum]|uniref:CBS domain-containing membrane protein n=1 Tax=Quisquiliibacterium transsilvanicum TaxID=1549638 RepID=A0A7W8M7P6_9BURK|nr:HPP family protein [Quisquiliibacterium transsilvanicum]MBB5270777.1 CBS domain-containing membrane protein [Quisquiliibacterium transsilvanicum]
MARLPRRLPAWFAARLPGRAPAWLLPPPLAMDRRERARAAAGAFVGIAMTAWLASLWSPGDGAVPMLIAPMGASAVLLFAVPASPLAQPWPVLCGNLVAALVGISAAKLLGPTMLGAAAAVGVTVALTSLLRSLHPPAGAVALTAVLGGPEVAEAGYRFVATPVMLDSILIVVAAILYNHLTGRSYPHVAHATAHPHAPPAQFQLSREELDEVLADYGEALDIDRDDLEALVRELAGRASQAQRMPPTPVTAPAPGRAP